MRNWQFLGLVAAIYITPHLAKSEAVVSAAVAAVLMLCFWVLDMAEDAARRRRKAKR